MAARSIVLEKKEKSLDVTFQRVQRRLISIEGAGKLRPFHVEGPIKTEKARELTVGFKSGK